MPADRSWQISTPQTLDFDAPVDELHVRVVNGTVNVVGTTGPGARIEIAEVKGPPLVVERTGGTLSVAYEDLPWKGFLKWLDRKGWHRRAVISVSVPAGARLSVGAVGACAVVSGMEGNTDVRGVSGETTLVGLSGPVRADTVSGNVEAQSLSGTLRFNSVSGDLTVIDGGGTSLNADSVSGDMVLDLAPEPGRPDEPTDIRLTTVSGDVALRLPRRPVDATVEANTTSGVLSNAFDELRVDGQWGAKRVTGVLGDGSGRLKATTISGSIALLRRPAQADPETDPGTGSGPGPGPADDVSPTLTKDV
ncbi:DUF4097 family beta strand repeat-containing protein [Streptomyces sp. NPDC054796]